MVFNSLTFVIFFTIVLALYSLPLPWKLRKLHLLVASYLFYAAWNPPFVVLLWLSTGVDWFAANAIGRSTSRARRHAFLMLSLSVNLGLLGAFKYGEFLVENFSVVLAGLGIEYAPPAFDLILPIGISFYTFQTLSYTIDVYRGRLAPCTQFVDFALYVTFFPQLVAGPIVRAADFLPQCSQPRRASSAQLGWGATLLVIGIFEKVVLADQVMAPVVDGVYSAPASAGFTDAWIATLAFSSQIFFDFAGYSTCAIGAGLCLGFRLPDNFHFPYAAVGFSDFWRRWHISLSSWLRDYLYIPMGGNRRGEGRTLANLAFTMLVGGLWHGASWRFVAWGGLHGAYLIAERGLRARFGEKQWLRHTGVQLALAMLTYLLVCVAWVFFRAGSFADAFLLLRTMTTGSDANLALGRISVLLVLATTGGLLVGQWMLRDRSLQSAWEALPWWLRSLLIASLCIGIMSFPGNDRAFIYFQF